MTIYTIKNDYLTVTIHEKGAMLWSIKDRKGCEYLWQGNPEFSEHYIFSGEVIPYALNRGRHYNQGKAS